MPGDQILLSDLKFDFLEIRCTRCDRHGRLSVARLIAEHGPDAGLVTLRHALAGDCPNRDAPVYERCDVFYPGLTENGPTT